MDAKLERKPLSAGAVVAGAVVLLLLAGAAGGQDQPELQPGVFTEIIDVRVINLEVVVTDQDGVRVVGLQPEDFVLTVDGQEVAIEYFTEVLGGASVAPDAPEGTVPALLPGEPVSTSYLLFIDEYFAINRDRDRLLDRMIEQLSLLGPQDRMAVVAFNGSSIEMLSSWTGSQEALRRVLESAKERPAFGLQRRAELRSFTAGRELRDRTGLRFSGERAAGLNTLLDIEEEAEVARITGQVKRAVMAAAATLRGFANPPGRKVMLLLSGGWPYNPAQWVLDDPARNIYTTSLPSGDDIYAPLIETANRLSYTIYAADMPAMNQTLTDVESLQVSQLDALGADPSRRFLREQETEMTLQQLAKMTGGRAFLNSASNGFFERVVEDTRSYYWLGFTPNWQGSDEAHDVRVTTRRPGFKVRARRNYADLSRATEVTMMVESSLLFGNTPGSESLPAALGPQKRAGIGKVLVPFKVAIPLHELTFLPQGDRQVASLELRVAVIDELGNTAEEIPVIPLTVRGDEQLDAEGYTIYENVLKIRKRPHDVVFALYEQTTGKILTSRLKFVPEGWKEKADKPKLKKKDRWPSRRGGGG